ncbi:hypothetical protein BpKM390_37050 [Burkholderia pseudomallei]|nr:hypothetical protein BMA10399_A0639 [Burkholderia mallei ATCC 10399]BEH20340.1 hypothetical protein GTC019_35180 [Burkholderia pseudomallei]BEH26362.1 hypothetical protein GTC050_36140 [Burkholderia pseudomallei]BEH32389.1 hypothetical protein GTC054_36050 [Burkholderia pseudomallei]BEH38387.1 hypothetical protein GTC254T_34820 [Burkholderia pseudomallei]
MPKPVVIESAQAYAVRSDVGSPPCESVPAGRTLMKPLLKAGDRIEGLHWVAEYRHRARLIRVLRERVEVGTYGAPSALFGDEEEMGASTPADHRGREAALRAYLRHFAKVHDAEE